MRLLEFWKKEKGHTHIKYGAGLKGLGEPNGTTVEYTLSDDGRHITSFTIVGGKTRNGPITADQIQSATEYANSDMTSLETAILGASAFPNLDSNKK